MTTRQKLEVWAGETNLDALVHLQCDDAETYTMLRDVTLQVYRIVRRTIANKLTAAQLREMVRMYVANLCADEKYSAVCAELTAIVGGAK